MAAADIVQRVRQHLYSSGVGESPVIVQCASDAAESVSAPTVSFALASGEVARAGVSAGDVLARIDSTSASNAFVLYVLSVSTDTVTAVNGYLGSTDVADTNLDGALLELNPTKSEWLIWQKIEAVFDNMLWPYVWKYNTRSVATPDLSSYQNEIEAAVYEVESAKQLWGDEWIEIPYELQRNLSTSVSSTGSLLTLGAHDSSTVYLATREKYVSSDTISESLQECVAVGAAAMILGADRAATNREASSKDSQFRGQRNPADQLWRDFITLRQGLSEDLSSQVEYFEYLRG